MGTDRAAFDCRNFLKDFARYVLVIVVEQKFGCYGRRVNGNPLETILALKGDPPETVSGASP